MIKAHHTFTGELVSRFFAGYRLDKAFRNIYITGNPIDEHLPVLMIANHFSWWDGFIQYRLNRHVYKRKLHVMMLEEQLSQHPILTQCGAFSIRKRSREIIESLNYCIKLLENTNNLVLLFPQGKIESIYTSYFIFEKGLAYIFKHLPNEIQLIFNVNLINYFSEKKPSLYIYYKKCTLPPALDLKYIEKDFNRFANTCKLKQETKWHI